MGVMGAMKPTGATVFWVFLAFFLFSFVSPFFVFCTFFFSFFLFFFLCFLFLFFSLFFLSGRGWWGRWEPFLFHFSFVFFQKKNLLFFFCFSFVFFTFLLVGDGADGRDGGDGRGGGRWSPCFSKCSCCFVIYISSPFFLFSFFPFVFPIPFAPPALGDQF